MSDELAYHSTRSATATFRAFTVTTAQQFALLSQPFQPETPQSGKSTPAPHDATRAHRSAQPEPPSTEPATGHGLSLQQLQHLAALTAVNDAPRDTSSVSLFSYMSSSAGTRGRRNRLSLDSAQRRLDSWNRASNVGLENSSDPLPASLNTSRKNFSDSRGPAQPLEAVISDAARSQASRHSPRRRSRSAHALGEKDTPMPSSDAALVWRRGGAVTYRRPEGPTPSSLLAAASTNSRHRHARDSRQHIFPSARSESAVPVRACAPALSAVTVVSNATATSRLPSPLHHSPLPASVASQPSAKSQRLWSSPYVNARVTTQEVTNYDNQCRARTAHPAGYHAGSARTSVVPMCNEHGHSKLQLQRALRDPVRSVFTWAAEQRIASRRALSAQQ
ncbi:unnamed protein product [Closterium sp. NIES-54]